MVLQYTEGDPVSFRFLSKFKKEHKSVRRVCTHSWFSFLISRSDGGASWGVIHSIIGGCLTEQEPGIQGVGNSQLTTRTLTFKVRSNASATNHVTRTDNTFPSDGSRHTPSIKRLVRMDMDGQYGRNSGDVHELRLGLCSIVIASATYGSGHVQSQHW